MLNLIYAECCCSAESRFAECRGTFERNENKSFHRVFLNKSKIEITIILGPTL